jgi:two-component sensor histidine kinase
MSQRGPIYGLRKDGAEFPAEASISHVEAGDEQILTVILRDVSESRAAEREMRETLREKEVLLREVHHRVKNNLQVIISLLGLQARTTAAGPLRAALEESQARIRSMALIHEQLYQTKTFADVNLPEYLRQLSSQLFSSYQVRPNVRLETEIGDVRLGVDVAVPCGLILNELLSNSLKYAFPDDRPGVVSIELTRREDGSIVLVVADDGVGTPPEISFWSTRTLGLRLVRSLVRQLDGEIEREGPPGTRYRMRFAPPAEAQAREMP